MLTRTIALIGAVAVDLLSIATAAECHNRPELLGTSRTLAVNPRATPTVGGAQYGKTLPLNRREVVLTFDSGPSSPYTEVILNALAEQCVKATFFALGKNTQADPEQLHRVALQGHSVGSQTFNHVSLATLPFAVARDEIDQGIKAVDSALQESKRAPFFRAPMLQLTPQSTRYLASLGMMIWAHDVDSRDWSDATEEQVVAQIMSGLDKAGRGIVTMQDMQPKTARALPVLLEQLKRRNYRVVHVVGNPAPAAAPAPKKSGKRTGV